MKYEFDEFNVNVYDHTGNVNTAFRNFNKVQETNSYNEIANFTDSYNNSGNYAIFEFKFNKQINLNHRYATWGQNFG